MGSTHHSKSIELLAQDVIAGKRRALAKAITLVESARSDHRSDASELLALLAPHAGQSLRIGISGSPGVGKSTFIENMGLHIIEQGHKLAVLAVDPSSPLTGGSILGDKTRMEYLSRNRSAFIRPSPAGSELGGVAARTYESMLVCEAAGFDIIFIETVGVGQSETAVADMTDLFLLLLLPSGGDDLQGIKKGIMELADVILVNKADGPLERTAKQTVLDYRAALSLLRGKDQATEVFPCSAVKQTGLSDIWSYIQSRTEEAKAEGYLEQRRQRHIEKRFWTTLRQTLMEDFKKSDRLQGATAEALHQVKLNQRSPWQAAMDLIELYRSTKG